MFLPSVGWFVVTMCWPEVGSGPVGWSSALSSCIAAATGDDGGRETDSQNGAGVLEPRHRDRGRQHVGWEQQRDERPCACGDDCGVGGMVWPSSEREAVGCDTESEQRGTASPDAKRWLRPSQCCPAEQQQRRGGNAADGDEQREAPEEPGSSGRRHGVHQAAGRVIDGDRRCAGEHTDPQDGQNSLCVVSTRTGENSGA